MLGDRYKIKLDTHSTATHLEIYALITDEKLLVYYKTNWISSKYEFNERNKIIGFQCKGPWVQEINRWFLDVKVAVEEEKNRRIAAEKAKNKTEQECHKAKIEQFQKVFTGNE